MGNTLIYFSIITFLLSTIAALFTINYKSAIILTLNGFVLFCIASFLGISL